MIASAKSLGPRALTPHGRASRPKGDTPGYKGGTRNPKSDVSALVALDTVTCVNTPRSGGQ